MGISKKTRFEVFKRDGFQCQYCGKTPPEITLEIDHILPKKHKGKDGFDNLITACLDCNRGKGANLLSATIPPIQARLKEMQERELQLKEFYNYQRAIERRKKRDIEKLCEFWETASDGENYITDQGKKSIKNLLRIFQAHEITAAIEIAWDNSLIAQERKFNYTCGILWTRKRQRENKGAIDNGERTDDK